eukprot:422350_1
MFQDLKKVRIIFADDFKFSDKFIQRLYDNLCGEFLLCSFAFETIEFCFHSKLIPNSLREQMADELQDDFDNIGWIISIPNSESVFFTKINASSNPKYKPLSKALKTIVPEESNSSKNEWEWKTDNTAHDCYVAAEQHVAKFHTIIPYKSEILSNNKLATAFAFMQSKEPPLDLWRLHINVALFINVLCVAHTIIQLGFMHYGPEPYRWISAVFFAITQLIILTMWFVCSWRLRVMLEDNYDCCDCYDCQLVFTTFFILGLIMFPVIPVIIFISLCIFKKKDLDFEFGFCGQNTLWWTCICSAVVGLFQAFSQLIILTVMLSIDDTHISKDETNVVTWSFCSSIATLMAFIVYLSSIYEVTTIYILNIVWLCLDYAIFLFILAILFYDNSCFVIFVIDYCILIFPFIFAAYWGFYEWNKEFHEEMNDMIENKEYGEIIAYTTIRLLITCGVIFCAMTFFLWIVIPIILFTVGVWTFFWICGLSQVYDCNIFPFCMIFDDRDFRAKYRLLKWTLKGENEIERNLRLCCINMVLLDQTNSDEFRTLKHIMLAYCTDADTLSNNGVVALKESKHRRIKLNFKHPDIEVNGHEIYHIWNVFFISKLMHIIFPIIILLYIGNSEHWNFQNVNFLIKYLALLILILYICCVIGFIMAWISFDYYRLIIFSESYNTNAMLKHIANCYSFIQIREILLNILGSQDIVKIISDYVSTSQILETEQIENSGEQIQNRDNQFANDLDSAMREDEKEQFIRETDSSNNTNLFNEHSSDAGSDHRSMGYRYTRVRGEYQYVKTDII